MIRSDAMAKAAMIGTSLILATSGCVATPRAKPTADVRYPPLPEPPVIPATR